MTISGQHHGGHEWHRNRSGENEKGANIIQKGDYSDPLEPDERDNCEHRQHGRYCDRWAKQEMLEK